MPRESEDWISSSELEKALNYPLSLDRPRRIRIAESLETEGVRALHLRINARLYTFVHRDDLERHLQRIRSGEIPPSWWYKRLKSSAKKAGHDWS